jgi:hypothetical protein
LQRPRWLATSASGTAQAVVAQPDEHLPPPRVLASELALRDSITWPAGQLEVAASGEKSSWKEMPVGARDSGGGECTEHDVVLGHVLRTRKPSRKRMRDRPICSKRGHLGVSA